MAGKIYAEIYGCSASLADGEIALGLMRDSGYQVTEDPAEADVLLLVTCAVKKPTSDRMISRMKRLSHYPGKLLVAGCMVTGEPERVRKTAPQALLIAPRDITSITEILEGAHQDGGGVKLGYPRIRRNPVISVIPVSEGCRWSRCSFCIVPKTRPGYRSYPIQLVLDEVRAGLREGIREYWLTSQDMGSYGVESGRNLLPLLVRSVDSLEGEFLVRIGMMNPIYLKPIVADLVDAFKGRHIFKFLHLPVQSGSEYVLKTMSRGHSVSLFEEIVQAFRAEIPAITLSTDIIVGYPTEDEEDFEDTLRLVERVKPDVVNISRFFPRPGTSAEGMKTLPPKILSRRVNLLRDVVSRVQLELNSRWIGWEGPALVDERGRNSLMVARNSHYKPIVLNTTENLLGRFVWVRVTDYSHHYLRGEVVNG
ncbi:tRNA-2-methylthio-N(6)-dimethylallyladenosine synthase [archaeon HR01]|nr:tRNA-2-methylthio-N(6)-dimethylallyladenosine synthase [archaeon HR01]